LAKARGRRLRSSAPPDKYRTLHEMQSFPASPPGRFAKQMPAPPLRQGDRPGKTQDRTSVSSATRMFSLAIAGR
jgi:hypothetical protein